MANGPLTEDDNIVHFLHCLAQARLACGNSMWHGSHRGLSTCKLLREGARRNRRLECRPADEIQCADDTGDVARE